MPDAVTMDKIVSLAKRRGFVFPSSEIYGGLGSAYDYGHYGVLLKENVKARWLEAMVRERDDIVALDSSIILHPAVWEASGHVAGFSDPLVDCRFCKRRYRADHLDRGRSAAREPSKRPGETEQCDLTEPRQFNLMFSHADRRRSRRPARTRTCGPRPRRASSSTSRTSPRSRAASRRSGSRRSARRSATRSRLATSSSARSSSSRWRWSTSCRRPRRRNGSRTGSSSASPGTCAMACARATCACARTTPRSSRTTRRPRATSSTSSRSAGPSSRGSRTAATSTSPHTRQRRARSSSGWTARSATRRTSSSRRSA